ncbi:hypothetical protein ALC53_00688 [Atta colombica]|uniref:Uncharacterized protein n=1 Tax=Atta colombica TaxID=520822 RepID=A0A195BXT1_9HYME|nr:hypothetical protein ALC53_00688 [Atta colombica]
MRLSVVFLILTIVVCAMFQESEFPKNNQEKVRNVVVNLDVIKQPPPPPPPPPLPPPQPQVEKDATSWTQFHLNLKI